MANLRQFLVILMKMFGNRVEALKTKGSRRVARTLFNLAASPGLEPRLTESESAVLPLDDEALIHLRLIYGKKISLSITLFYFATYKIRNKQKRYC